MTRAFSVTVLLATLLLISSSPAFCGDDFPKSVQTQYTMIRYAEDTEFLDFSWRVGGSRLGLEEALSVTSNRVDELIEKVQNILDLHPQKFHVEILLKPHYTQGTIAEYNDTQKHIVVYADRVTDGVLAHELAHAILCAAIIPPPPEKVQEILAQYVDKHLWAEV